MRIGGFKRVADPTSQTISARIDWEQADRPSSEIFFRVVGEGPVLRNDNYHPFLVGALVPALRYGEQRIKVEGPVCPFLKENLLSLSAYLTAWYWYDYGLRPREFRTLVIESDDAAEPRATSARTGCFFSGGVDSLCMVRQNRLRFPLNHPASIRDALFVHGFDMGGRPDRGTEEDAFRYMAEEFREVADEASLNLIPIFTNVASLEPSYSAWRAEFMGPAMGAVAHVFSGYLSDVCIASSQDAGDWLDRYASHGLTDPTLGSYDLRIHHADVRLLRIEKVRIVADWPTALRRLRVCLYGTKGRLNCGRCEKCTRTALELICAGRQSEAAALVGEVITPQLVTERLELKTDTVQFYLRIARVLEERGAHELARAVRRILRRRYFLPLGTMRDTVRSADERFFAGRLKRTYQRFSRA